MKTIETLRYMNKNSEVNINHKHYFIGERGKEERHSQSVQLKIGDIY